MESFYMYSLIEKKFRNVYFEIKLFLKIICYFSPFLIYIQANVIIEINWSINIYAQETDWKQNDSYITN